MIDKMVTFTDEMHKETAYSKLKYSKEKTYSFFDKIIKAGQFVYLTDECLMVGSISSTFFGDSLVANDILIYVKKEFRGFGHAGLALSNFIKWAESKGADSIIIGQTTGVCGKEFKSLAGACGFVKLGEVYAR
jgi:GNAT superfamily N-acetyltransferase